jgi:type VI secretion system protein VasD
MKKFDMKRASPLKFLALLAAAITLIGCASGPEIPRMTLNIETTSTLNPDLHGRASPVVLYIYSLKTSSIFKNARFIELYSNKEDVLGMDLLGVEEIEISPGELINLAQRDLPEGTRHIGIVVAFRDIDNATWRGLIDIEPKEKFDFNIHIENLSVTVGVN